MNAPPLPYTTLFQIIDFCRTRITRISFLKTRVYKKKHDISTHTAHAQNHISTLNSYYSLCFTYTDFNTAHPKIIQHIDNNSKLIPAIAFFTSLFY